MPRLRGQKIALVIGVNETPAAADDLYPLTAPEREATRLAALLMSPACGFTIHGNGPLLGKTAIAEDIQQIIQHYTTTLGEHDTLLVYFCGHGFPLLIHDDVFLATTDFSRRQAQKHPEDFLSMRWLRETLLYQPTLRRILLILDCCYAGEIAGGGRSVMEILEQPGRPALAPTAELRSALVATLPHKPAKAELNHTWFSRYLLEGLEGNAIDEDQNVTLGRLKDYINRHMPPDQQCGVYGIDHTRDFRLAHYKDGMPLRKLSVADTLDQLRMRERLTIAAQHEESTRLFQLRLKGFVGRVAERAAIRGLIDSMQPTGGYVLIKGLAGEGKSSLIASLISEDGVTTTPHHFIALTPGREYQLSLLRALIAQLILKHELSVTYFPEESYSAMRDYLAVILKQLAARGVQETIYLDGLDQLPIDFDGRRDLSFLPPQPPRGIVIVLGTRPDDTLTPLNPLHRSEYALPHVSLEDFKGMLANRNLQFAAHTAEQLYTALDQNALYLALASDELQRTPTTDVATFVRTMTTNPADFFQLTLDRIRRQDRLLWNDIIKPVLSVLLATQEPLTHPMLRSLLTVDHDDLHDGLERLGGLVGKSVAGGFFLYHLKLREFLQDPAGNGADRSIFFAQEDLQIWHQRIATWCLPTEEAATTIWTTTTGVEQERRRYAHHHALYHLAAGGQWERLWAIIADGRYGQAKCRYDPSTQHYARDLDLARTMAVHAGTITQLWWLSLLRVTLTHRVEQWPQNLFVAMASLGRYAEALGGIELLLDPTIKVAALCSVAAVIPPDNAPDVWQRALVIADAITDRNERAKTLHTIATALARAGHLTDAQVIADTIPDAPIRTDALEAIANARTQASRSANTPRPATNAHDHILTTLSVNLTHVGTITDARKRASALSDITINLVKAGHTDTAQRIFAEAQAISDTITDTRIRDQALSALSLALVKAGRLTDARAAAAGIRTAHHQTSALNAIATALAYARDFDNARTIADTITDVEIRVRAISALALSLALTNQATTALRTFADARTIADTITDVYARNRVLRDLADAQATTDQGRGHVDRTFYALRDLLTLSQARNPHVDMVMKLYQQGESHEAERYLRRTWYEKETPSTLLECLALVTPWITHDAIHLSTVLESFSWVDAQMSAIATKRT